MKSILCAIALLMLTFSCVTNDAEAIVAERNSENVPIDLPFNASKEQATEFAWETFLAINVLKKDGTGTLWENYKEGYDIFLKNAEKPTAWGKSTPSTDPPCADFSDGAKVLRTTSKISPIINETDQAVGGILIDQDSNVVHYEVYMNKPMFQYVLENEFYNAMKQSGSDINFPDGSMELKASWKILDPKKDDISRYHSAKAFIYIPDSAKVFQENTVPIGVKDKINSCSEQLVGLVGLHIVYKTPSNPNFVWMTFEQNDNLVVDKSAPAGTKPSFYNPDDTEARENCRQWDCPEQVATQVVRQTIIPDWIEESNTKYQKKLQKENSVWANYKLIGVQWPTDKTRTGNPHQPILANSTMETFNQTGSSCIGCHSFARSSNKSIYSDFSWVMGRAQSPKNGLPDATGKDVLNYVMYMKPYKYWGTWSDPQWNDFSKPSKGENPHGNFIRVFVNDIALKAYKDDPSISILPEGSIVLKENYSTPDSSFMKNKAVQPSELIELTIMYKAKDENGTLKWFWMKTPPNGPFDSASFNQQGCISCHTLWHGNGDGMLSFNFGKRPVITKTPFDLRSEEIERVELK
ncbi:MAG: hypothetical protein ACJASQ_000069 [Crocinitomicaceae bacterium]|jgi:hypothetical protein